MKLAVTKCLKVSGLIDLLVEEFKKKTGIDTEINAVGTDKALELGREGKVDIIITHSKKDELLFINKSYGSKRRDLMYNYYIIIGPKNDPVKIKEALSITDALENIAEKKYKFISRGDDSGTYKKETELWKLSGITPNGDWYDIVKKDMKDTILECNKKSAYTLVDRGTYIKLKKDISLKICFEGDPDLFNPYGIIIVNPEKYEHINIEEANQFMDWIIFKEGQKIINQYSIDNEQLYYIYR